MDEFRGVVFQSGAHGRGMGRLAMFLACLWLAAMPAAATVHGTDLSRLFASYQAELGALRQALAGGNWPGAARAARGLTDQSEILVHMGRELGNRSWEYYARNLFNHGQELLVATAAHDGAEAIALTATLTNHIGQIQAANPHWLREYLEQQFHLLEEGVRVRNREQVRNAAEIIHASADKIALSAAVVPEAYLHTRWLGNIIFLNELGDALLGEVNRGEWSNSGEKLAHIRLVLTRWREAFR